MRHINAIDQTCLQLALGNLALCSDMLASSCIVYYLIMEYSVCCDCGVVRPELDDLADGIRWDQVAVGFAAVLGNDSVADSLRT
jgi:hypothetical protein